MVGTVIAIPSYSIQDDYEVKKKLCTTALNIA
jgi:hypothetical protein